MTNEQARKILSEYLDLDKEEHSEFLEAIRTLIQPQADGEYISRQALLDDLYKRDYTKFTHRDFVALVQYQDIVAIPNKVGHWIHDDYNAIYEWRCSECNRGIADMPTGMGEPLYKFCPWCGAKMGGEQDG